MLNINQTKKISGELKSDVFFCEQIDGPIPMGVISGGWGGEAITGGVHLEFLGGDVPLGTWNP